MSLLRLLSMAIISIIEIRLKIRNGCEQNKLEENNVAQQTNLALAELITARFGKTDGLVEDLPPSVRDMAARGSCRSFTDRTVHDEMLRSICAVALASPTKSDLQQRDIILVRSREKRREIAELISAQHWIADAPVIAVFCGNNRRQRLLHEWTDVPFENDHLDAFFNAAVDAGVALSAFVTAAEASGLGCCPISAVRNSPETMSDLLALPDHVFPVAGLAIGYPAAPAPISMRLPLDVTVHMDAYSETDLHAKVQTYDSDRATAQPYSSQRIPQVYGDSPDYGWMQDKTRQYSQPERAGFGAFVRRKGFNLE